jgi:uncharacterized protein (DUF1778 family)
MLWALSSSRRPVIPSRCLLPDARLPSLLGDTHLLKLFVKYLVKEEAMSTKTIRREIRLTASDDDLITEAAGLVGVTVDEFLVGRAVADAEVVIESHHSIRLHLDAYDRFLKALDRPTVPVAALVEQFRRSRPLEAR